MVLDNQGCGGTYFDPEVATLESFDDVGELLFCGGKSFQNCNK